VYTALIAEVEGQGGSVIDFAGDSIVCWFDVLGVENQRTGDGRQQTGDASQRAVTCAFALQQAMLAFDSIALPNRTTTALTLKVAVASGNARRFVVGDPNIHYMDALAGATVARTSTAEHLATKGDVLVDEATVNVLGEALTIQEWRTDNGTNERFAVIQQGKVSREQRSENTDSQPLTLAPEVSIEQLRDWVHKAQVEREESLLTEFRPCVALFVRFTGIDYDLENAQKQLDGFVRSAQRIVERHEGAFLQITIGDNGSYAYINFGALSTHEDDARRAVKVAIELCNMAKQLGFLQPLQIGITQGVMRVGAYGGQTRKTFGALGDEVNLAARLMSNAATGEILVSGYVYKAIANDFVFEPRSPLAMKGKAEPLPVFVVTGARKQRATTCATVDSTPPT